MDPSAIAFTDILFHLIEFMYMYLYYWRGMSIRSILYIFISVYIIEGVYITLFSVMIRRWWDWDQILIQLVLETLVDVYLNLSEFWLNSKTYFYSLTLIYWFFYSFHHYLVIFLYSFFTLIYWNFYSFSPNLVVLLLFSP